MERRSFKRWHSSFVLGPTNPNLLASWIHNCHLGIACVVIARHLLVNSFICNIAPIRFDNLAHTSVPVGLVPLIIEEDTVHLGVSRLIKWHHEVLVIPEAHPVLSIVEAAEGVVSCGAETSVDHDGTASVC